MIEYQPLSARAKIGALMLASLIACANLVAAWCIAYKAIDEIPMSPSNIEHIKQLSTGASDSNVAANNLSLRVHAINTQVHLKAITNKQSIIVISIGSGFAFLAIGFALYIIGADGAFSARLQDQSSELHLSATTPGIVCFVFAAALIAYGVSRQYQLNVGSVEFFGSSASSQTVEGDTDKVSTSVPNP